MADTHKAELQMCSNKLLFYLMYIDVIQDNMCDLFYQGGGCSSHGTKSVLPSLKQLS